MRNNNFLPKETVLRIIDSPRTKEQMADMIKGIPEVEAVEIKEGMTNGDMIKAMFNTEIVDELPFSYEVELNDTNYVQFDKNWWNAPYKKEAGK